MRLLRLVLALGLLVPALASCDASVTFEVSPASAKVQVPEEPEAAQLEPGLFERLAFLGSSASDGFNLQLETGAPTRLADYFEAGLLVDYGIAMDGATSATFMDPERIAGEAVAAAVAADPSLVVGVDFLFWFFYGSGGPGNTVEFRRDRLEAGMALLDKFDCPILVGDLPNMSGAAGGMIPLSSMPPADSFESANERIRAWAATKPNVTIVPLAAFNETVATGEPFAIGNETWDPAESGELLQFDQLHPNLAGAAILALQILHSLAGSRGATLEGTMITNPEDLIDAVDDLISARD